MSCFVRQTGPTDLRHFDPEFTHLPVSSSLCNDTLTVTSSIKEAAGAFPGFSYGPPAELSFMWTLISVLGTHRKEEKQDKNCGLSLTLTEGPHQSSLCFLRWRIRLTNRIWSVWMTSCMMWTPPWLHRSYSSASSSQNNKCVPSVYALWDQQTSLSVRSHSDRWRREVPEVQKAVWAMAAAAFIKNYNIIILLTWTFDQCFSRLEWCLLYMSTYVETVFWSSWCDMFFFLCECKIALEDTMVGKVTHSTLKLLWGV